MLPEWAKGSILWEALFAVAVVGASLVMAFLLLPLLSRAVRSFTRLTKTTLDDLLLEAVRKPLFIFIIVQGIFVGLALTSFLDRWQHGLSKAWVALVGAVALVGLQRVINALLTWYGAEAARKTGAKTDDKLMPLVHRLVTVIVYAVGGLLILNNLGIEVSPLIAGLGLGGLAVALALQPTLSNFISGTYLASANVLKPGDFIELENNLRGYVVEVGWRNTRLRTPFNNMVTIPNSRLADSILTNYAQPTMEIGVLVEAGVSYSSDLAHVQHVALEVAMEVVWELPEASKSAEPWFGYERFGESNVDFWLWVTATDRISSFTLKTELMKRLHARFAKEGIEINYPVRKLVYASTDSSDASFLTSTKG